MAEAYVAEQLRKAGLEPAGSKGYYQSVKLQSGQIIEKDSSMAILRDGQIDRLTSRDDAYFNLRVDNAPEVGAPLVFA